MESTSLARPCGVTACAGTDRMGCVTPMQEQFRHSRHGPRTGVYDSRQQGVACTARWCRTTFANPRNVGPLEGATHRGTGGAPGGGPYRFLWLRGGRPDPTMLRVVGLDLPGPRSTTRPLFAVLAAALWMAAALSGLCNDPASRLTGNHSVVLATALFRAEVGVELHRRRTTSPDSVEAVSITIPGSRFRAGFRRIRVHGRDATLSYSLRDRAGLCWSVRGEPRLGERAVPRA